MVRKFWIVLGVVLGGLAMAVLGRQQAARLGGAATPGEKQWDFDQGELRTLMDRTLHEQQGIIAGATGEERERAEKFRTYYEGRRQAIAR